MKQYQIGEFEEVVMLIVGILYDKAYGVAIKTEIEQRLKRKVSVGALQSALRRLEKKGFLDSREGEANTSRGGKPKRYFTITAYGKEALQYNQDMRSKLWNEIPQVALDLKMV